MRIMITCQGLYSHFYPIVWPVAKTLSRAGNDVTLFVSESLHVTEEVREEIEVVEVAPGPTLDQVMRSSGLLLNEEFDVRRFTPTADAGFDLMPMTGTARTYARAFAGVMGIASYSALTDAMKGRRLPDVVVRESTEYGGMYFAMAEGLPFYDLDIAPMSARSLVDRMTRYVGEEILGLGAEGKAPRRLSTANFIPPSLLELNDYAARGHCYSVPARSDTSEESTLESEVESIRDGRPLVLAGLGSSLPDRVHRRFKTLLMEVFDGLPFSCLIIGTDGVLRQDGSNVYSVGFVDQSALLRHADVFVSHGGFNGVRESISAGVPTVMLPTFGDQFANARVVDRAGAGVELDWGVDPARLRASLVEMISDERVHATMAEIVDQFRRLRDLGDLPADLEEYVADS